MLVLPFDSPAATLENSGGKALNLVRLTRAGFSVPPGVIVTTDGYRAFVAANGLDAVIAARTQGLDPADAAGLETASQSIRAAFRAGSLPPDLARELHEVANAWAHVPLAVRSSATAEDLTDASFAGQQDTFLNVLGLEPLLAAVVECWSSLWTARAIDYRLRNAVDGASASVAVVVQELVASEVSGVMFTANPLTGHRGQTTIDATPGLGEALVSGQVEPDHWVVDTASGTIVEAVRGSKAVRTVAVPGGGVTTAASEDRQGLCLTDDQARSLTRLGARIQAEYGVPQDIEWALADGRLRVLQSRAITSLYPLPSDDPRSMWFSFGAFQGLLAPITPLGRDVLRLLVSRAAEIFGYPDVRPDDIAILHSAGERFWIRIDGVLRHPIAGPKILPRVLAMVEPGTLSIVRRLAAEPAFAPTSSRPGLPVRLATSFLRSMPGRLARSLRRPARTREAFERFVENEVTDVARAARAVDALGTPAARCAGRVRLVRSLGSLPLRRVLPEFAPIMAPGVIMMGALMDLGRTIGGEKGRALAAVCLRALPGNVTTAMDLALWRTSREIAADGPSRAAFVGTGADVLARRYLEGALPDVAQRSLGSFLATYGMRGLGELDLGTPRWRERPSDVITMLQGYLAIDDPAKAPDALFDAAERDAAAALEQLLALAAENDPLGIRRRQVRFLVSRLRGIFGARETPKFTIIRIFGILRAGLLATGRDLVEAGRLDAPEDVAYLHLDELAAAFSSGIDLRALVVERTAVRERELRRRQVPLVIVGDGRTFLTGISDVPGSITGSPVSPGVVTGRVRVVRDPTAAALEPGEIMVCPGTDPSWTPLFLTAAGLVTEVGGMMTHGSVVAREYGIPAVVGVPDATTRLVTGQLIRLDGSTGLIELLEPDDTAS